MEPSCGATLVALSANCLPRKMVFELKHYHGMKLRKVADLVGLTEGTAKNILFRTRRSCECS